MPAQKRGQKHGVAKNPCAACRGDDAPRCQRCVARDVECIRTPRPNLFRRGTSSAYDAQFPASQSWVNSRPRKFCNRGQVAKNIVSSNSTNTTSSSPTSPLSSIEDASTALVHLAAADLDAATTVAESPCVLQGSVDFSNGSPTSTVGTTSGLQVQQVQTHHVQHVQEPLPSQQYIPATLVPVVPRPLSVQPLKNTTEACLLRYYIEELAYWFDTCDPMRHFETVVPKRARSCPVLLNAIFAVAARHLVRVPKYATEHGIVYYGQRLPDLTLFTGVEYMLQCIPFLQEFHTIVDEEDQENLMAATVILRQYEEIEEEENEEVGEGGEGEQDGGLSAASTANFLAIMQEIIHMARWAPTSRSLSRAAFLVFVRQEVYCAFTQERAPQMQRMGEHIQNHLSLANRIVLHTTEVLQWRWGGNDNNNNNNNNNNNRNESTWLRLREQHRALSRLAKDQLVPVLEREADRTCGEIFPAKWFASNEDLVATQHLALARMILVAEKPGLGHSSPGRLRQTESLVRAAVLDVCGTGLCHQRLPPAVVTGAMAIMAYGDYFTDAVEREALWEVVETTRRYCAWPVQKARERLEERWQTREEDGLE